MFNFSKNLNVTFVAIIIALFTLTSCEKENIQEMTAETTAPKTERNLPADGINVVFDEVKTQASAAKFKQSAQGRNKGYKEIGCGFNYDGCTINQGNSIDYRHYPDNIDALAAFDGEDEYFFFEVAATPGMIMTYEIALTELSVDLDLFVFALNSNYQITATKAMSINSYDRDEKIKLRDLAPGLYIVAVDAYQRGIAGHYNLTMNCGAVSANPPSINREIKRIVTDFGEFWANGNEEWTFIATGSDMAFLYDVTFQDDNNISLENVTTFGKVVTTTSVHLGLDVLDAVQTTHTDDGEALAIGDYFGKILSIEYKD